MGKVEDALAEIAAVQFGAVARKQTRDAGVTTTALNRRIKAGHFSDVTDRVIVATASTDSFERRAMVALLDAGDGAALSHTTGAAEFGIAGFALEPIHVSRPRRSRREPTAGVIWHHPRFLPVSHLVRRPNGLTVTSPTRTLADLAGLPEIHPKRVERAINNAWSSGLTDGRRLTVMAKEWCERGRRGSAFLHEYLDSRAIDWTPPASNLAARFIQIVVDAGMPEPISEVNIGDNERWLGRVDCLDPQYRLVAEIDSDRFHAAPLDQQSDADRDATMEVAGFEIERFKEFEVWHRPSDVADRWRQARDRARRIHKS